MWESDKAEGMGELNHISPLKRVEIKFDSKHTENQLIG